MGIAMDQEKEIEQLYMDMYNRLIVYANVVLENHALAEEAVQETFRIACTKPNKLLSSPNPKGWLITVLRNVLCNMKRSRANLKRLVVALMGVSSWGDYDEINIDTLYSDLMDDKDFKLLKKVVLEQKSTIEIAQELGISVGACSKRIQRARKKLQQKLKDYSN